MSDLVKTPVNGSPTFAVFELMDSLMRTLMSVPGATVSVTLTGLGFSGTLGAALEPEGAPAAVGLDEEAVGALDASLGVVVDGAAAGVAELCVEALEAGCELLQPATTESKSKASVAGRTEGERRRYVMDTFYSCLLVQKTPKRALSPLQSPRYFNML